MIRGLFITGTDTGVGKTHFTTALARLLKEQGRRVSVSKPVATGAEKIGDRWVNDDTRRLAQVTGQPMPEITPFVFPEPAAPPVAAGAFGVTPSLADYAMAVHGAAQGDIVLVEGAGGLLCPLTDTETFADLAAMLALPLVIVTRRSLGTLNHTMLTVEAALRRGLPVAGVVMNETTPVRTVAEQTNLAELRRRLTVPILAVLPYETENDGNEALDAIRAVNWWDLASPLAQKQT